MSDNKGWAEVSPSPLLLLLLSLWPSFLSSSSSASFPTFLLFFVVPSFWERQREIFWCPECKMKFAAGLLEDHYQAQHGKEWLHKCVTPSLTIDPSLYRFSLTRAAGSIRYPVGSFEGQGTTHTNLRIHSVHCHVRYTLVVMEEGKRPHPLCMDFYMSVH